MISKLSIFLAVSGRLLDKSVDEVSPARGLGEGGDLDLDLEVGGLLEEEEEVEGGGAGGCGWCFFVPGSVDRAALCRLCPGHHVVVGARPDVAVGGGLCGCHPFHVVWLLYLVVPVVVLFLGLYYLLPPLGPLGGLPPLLGGVVGITIAAVGAAIGLLLVGVLDWKIYGPCGAWDLASRYVFPCDPFDEAPEALPLSPLPATAPAAPAAAPPQAAQTEAEAEARRAKAKATEAEAAPHHN